MSNKKAEERIATKDFPNLMMPNGRAVASIEIDVDALAKEEKYQFGGWDDLIRSITATWVRQNSYEGTGTIWQWGSPSVNFGHHSYSMFYAILGMPKSFQRYLKRELRVLRKDVRPDSDQVIPSLVDGWDTLCHIEGLKVWEQLDPSLWQEVHNAHPDASCAVLVCIAQPGH